MNIICTTIEQSRRLIDLGIDINTSDMHHVLIDTDEDKYDVGIGKYIGILPSCPAWSLEALLKQLPSEFTEEGKYSTTKYVIDIRKYRFTDDTDLYQIAYGSYKWHEDGNYSWNDMVNTPESESLLDAAFEMICWLLENNKI